MLASRVSFAEVSLLLAVAASHSGSRRGLRSLSHSQATNWRISGWVDDDQRIPALLPRYILSAERAGPVGLQCCDLVGQWKVYIGEGG